MPSTVIKLIEYSAALKELYITFVSGSTYVYLDVPEEVYEQFKVYREKGIFMNRYIKNHYSYRKVSADKDQKTS
jgi:uncharacterized protein YlzI (FlbEa/FlbD family)